MSVTGEDDIILTIIIYLYISATDLENVNGLSSPLQF